MYYTILFNRTLTDLECQISPITPYWTTWTTYVYPKNSAFFHENAPSTELKSSLFNGSNGNDDEDNDGDEGEGEEEKRDDDDNVDEGNEDVSVERQVEACSDVLSLCSFSASDSCNCGVDGEYNSLP